MNVVQDPTFCCVGAGCQRITCDTTTNNARSIDLLAESAATASRCAVYQNPASTMHQCGCGHNAPPATLAALQHCIRQSALTHSPHLAPVRCTQRMITAPIAKSLLSARQSYSVSVRLAWCRKPCSMRTQAGHTPARSSLDTAAADLQSSGHTNRARFGSVSIGNGAQCGTSSGTSLPGTTAYRSLAGTNMRSLPVASCSNLSKQMLPALSASTFIGSYLHGAVDRIA